MNSKKKQAKQYVDQNPIESFRDWGVGAATASSFLEQILGSGKSEQKHGDLAAGEALDLNALKDEAEHKPEVEAGIDYTREIVHAEVRVAQENKAEIQNQVAQIMAELKKLIAASEELKTQFKEVAVEQRIENPGKYHLTFLEWLLAVISTARMKVEDSQTWLQMFASKKKQKQYWSQFKKHGTTFGLSNERVVATQTG